MSREKNVTAQDMLLTTTNLIPLYILQDNLQSNFKKVNTFIQHSQETFQGLSKSIKTTQQQQSNLKVFFADQLKKMQKKIVNDINVELDGRIAIAIGKSIDSFTAKLQSREKNMQDTRVQFEGKLKKLKQDLKYELTTENQKYFTKQIKKVEQTISKSLKTSKKQATQVKAQNILGQQQVRQPQEGTKWQEQHHMILGLQARVKALQQFSVNVDKRLYNSLTSIKQSWKELGGQLLENKKSLAKKFDQLRLQFIKLKSLKQFTIPTGNIEDEFKRKMNQKFTQIYQLLSVTLTKTQYEATTQKLSLKLYRHDDQFLEIRKQLAVNNEFFTFYANNSNETDLKKEIEELENSMLANKQYVQTDIQKVRSEIKRNEQIIQQSSSNLKSTLDRLEHKIVLIDQMNEIVSNVNDRIESLEDFNRFGPAKLEKIHNALDIDFTATQRELIQNKNKKDSLNSFQQSHRQLRIQINKMKDEVFVLSSQNQLKDEQINQMKKNYKQLQNKLTKVKGQNEEAMASRKPWVCLSCDKQDRQKQHFKKQTKYKKPEPFKGFHQQRSEKNLKAPPTPPFEERFQVYEKFRQKYLTDTVKLPQIVKQKLKDRESSLLG